MEYLCITTDFWSYLHDHQREVAESQHHDRLSRAGNENVPPSPLEWVETLGQSLNWTALMAVAAAAAAAAAEMMTLKRRASN